MGHEIRYMTCEDTAKAKTNAVASANDMAMRDGDYHTQLDKPFRWLNAVCDSIDDAYEYIDEVDTGWYDQIAVSYRSEVKITKGMQNAVDRLNEERKKKSEYVESHHRKDTTTAKYVGCPKCGSKLSREHLRTDNCPMCRADLRPETVLSRIDRFDEKIKELEKKVQDEKRKASKNGKIRWLLKYEYHV